MAESKGLDDFKYKVQRLDPRYEREFTDYFNPGDSMTLDEADRLMMQLRAVFLPTVEWRVVPTEAK